MQLRLDQKRQTYRLEIRKAQKQNLLLEKRKYISARNEAQGSQHSTIEEEQNQGNPPKTLDYKIDNITQHKLRLLSEITQFGTLTPAARVSLEYFYDFLAQPDEVVLEYLQVIMDLLAHRLCSDLYDNASLIYKWGDKAYLSESIVVSYLRMIQGVDTCPNHKDMEILRNFLIAGTFDKKLLYRFVNVYNIYLGLHSLNDFIDIPWKTRINLYQGLRRIATVSKAQISNLINCEYIVSSTIKMLETSNEVSSIKTMLRFLLKLTLGQLTEVAGLLRKHPTFLPVICNYLNKTHIQVLEIVCNILHNLVTVRDSDLINYLDTSEALDRITSIALNNNDKNVRISAQCLFMNILSFSSQQQMITEILNFRGLDVMVRAIEQLVDKPLQFTLKTIKQLLGQCSQKSRRILSIQLENRRIISVLENVQNKFLAGDIPHIVREILNELRHSQQPNI